MRLNEFQPTEFTAFLIMKLTFTFLISFASLVLAGCSKTEPVAAAVEPSAEAKVASTDTVSPAINTAQTMSDLPELGAAPSWALKRLDGSVMRSEELAGKVVVLDFWATWCPPCRDEIPGYVEMQRELESQGVVIVGVSLDKGGPSVVEKFGRDYKINYPLVMGDNEVVGAFGGITAIPTTFLIDRNGQVRHRKVGSMERSDYEPLVKSLL